jgi:hypothetical protein
MQSNLFVSASLGLIIRLGCTCMIVLVVVFSPKQQQKRFLRDQFLSSLAASGMVDVIINKKRAAKRRKYAVDIIMTFYVKAFTGASKACLAGAKALTIKKGMWLKQSRSIKKYLVLKALGKL